MRDLYQTYADAPRVGFRPMVKTERDAEIVRRYIEDETLSALVKDFGVSEQRVWGIVRRKNRP